ncbi:MAG TPA: DUF933 domain-containing protein, partial [Bacillales bacterium]|nr:DUF933 domain-containing protein [Bacillales bacterium]
YARAEKLARHKDKEAAAEFEVLKKLKEAFENEKPARSVEFSKEEKKAVHHLHLLTMKPVLYVANVAEDEVADSENNPNVKKVKEYAADEGAEVVVISAKIESEIAELDGEEKEGFLQDLGIPESGLDQLIRASYDLLGLATYFTAGEPEVRAWTFRNGMKAPQAAGIIHTDFERGFIRAEVVSYDDLIAAGSMAAVRDEGKLRLEGKEYVVRDGDVIHFRFNV